MKIGVQTLKNVKYNVEVEETDTVRLATQRAVECVLLVACDTAVVSLQRCISCDCVISSSAASVTTVCLHL